MRRFSLNIMMLVVLTSLFLLEACYDDKGNYSYITLDEVVIDTTGCGIMSAYSIDRYDTMRLAPNIYLNGVLVNNDDSAPLDYVWTIYSNVTSSNTDYTVDTLGYSRVLEAEITRTADNYSILLTVTHQETGVQTYFSVTCTVEESITAGWMLLYEPTDNPGTSDVGLVVNSLVKKNIVTEKEFWNLYSASNGAPVNGNPVRIMHTLVSMTDDEVVIATDKNLVGVNQATFEKTLDFGDFFYQEPDNCDIGYYGVGGTTSRSELVINDNKVYTVSYSSLSRSNFFGVAKTGTYGELAGWSSDVRSYSNYDAVVYDQTNGCFKCASRNSVNLVSFGSQNTDVAAFDVNDVGMDLLMGDWGRSYYDYNLMQKGSEYYLTVSNFYSSSLSTTNVGLGLYNITASPEIADATSMAAAYAGEYVLYGAGNSVYNLKYNSSTTAEAIWTASSSAEKVTCVRLQKYYFYTLFLMIMPNPSSVLHIATYNEETGEGKLYQYQINSASGAITSDPKEYTVPGKVKDMAWKYIMEY